MNRFRELRLEKNLSQAEIANEIGVEQQTYSQYESGKTKPSLGILEKLAEFFGVTIDYLIGKSNIRSMPMDKKDFIGWTKDDLIKKGILPANRDLTEQELEEMKDKLLEIAKIMGIK